MISPAYADRSEWDFGQYLDFLRFFGLFWVRGRVFRYDNLKFDTNSTRRIDPRHPDSPNTSYLETSVTCIFTLSRPVCYFVQQVTFQKVKTVYKSRDLLYHQKMAYPRTDAQRPTYWKVINYYSKRFHESRVIKFSVGETSKNEKIRVRQNRGSSFYFFKKETLYILKIETCFRTYQSSVVRPPAVFFPKK